jgi:hypothetical protein
MPYSIDFVGVGIDIIEGIVAGGLGYTFADLLTKIVVSGGFTVPTATPLMVGALLFTGYALENVKSKVKRQ